MKNILFCLFLLASNALFAQLELPQKSPKASVSYRVGLTDVSVEYHSPAVNKRAIFGSLVPYDQVWRAGANEATNVVFGTDVMIGDVKVSKGRYAFFLIPKNGTTWIAVFNSDFGQWGAYGYKENKDIARLEVKVDALVKPVERLQYIVEDHGIGEGAIVMQWERKRVSVPFKIETMKIAMANVDQALASAKEEDKSSIHGRAAEFLLNNGGDMASATTHIQESVKLKETVWNLWLKAQIQAKIGEYPAAVETAGKLAEASKASKDEADYYAEIEKDVNSSVAMWKKKK